MFNIIFNIEKWKYNPEYELYVSNMGHFKTKEKRECPIRIDDAGYCCVYAYGTVHRNVACHRAVMLTWRPTINAEHLTVDHLDHNKRNNALSNLEWITKEENEFRAKADLVTIKATNTTINSENCTIVANTVNTKTLNAVKGNETVTEEFMIREVRFSRDQIHAIWLSYNPEMRLNKADKKLDAMQSGSETTIAGIKIRKI